MRVRKDLISGLGLCAIVALLMGCDGAAGDDASVPDSGGSLDSGSGEPDAGPADGGVELDSGLGRDATPDAPDGGREDSGPLPSDGGSEADGGPLDAGFSCTPDAFIECDGAERITCGSDNDLVRTACEFGCSPSEMDCNACAPDSVFCVGDDQLTCGSSGSVTQTTYCPLGCDAGECRALQPSNLGTSVDWCAAAASNLALGSGESMTLDGTGCTHLIEQGTDLPSICVYVFDTVTIAEGATLTLTGEPAVAILATASMRIDGAIDAAGAADVSGPGWVLDGRAFGQRNVRGGGGGAGHSTSGGDGSDSSPRAGGPAYGAETLIPMRGGSSGQDGGTDSFLMGRGAHGGGGGGALQLVACGSVAVSSTAVIDVGGGGGAGGEDRFFAPGVGEGGPYGGGGGGSGGSILLEAVSVVVAGVLAANGGGGGGGGADDNGGAGADGTTSGMPAAGGTPGSDSAGSGGTGGSSADDAQPGASSQFQAHGGGGGAAGRIRINDSMGSPLISGAVSPVATTGIVTAR